MMFLRSLRRGRAVPVAAAPVAAAAAALAIFEFPYDLLRDFFLAGDRLGRTLAGARIGMRALAMDRQAAAMAQAAVAGEVHQALDVHRHFATQVAFDGIVLVDRLTDADHLVVGQRIHATRLVDPHLGQNLLGFRQADPVDVLQSDDRTFGGRNVHAGYTSQIPTPSKTYGALTRARFRSAGPGKARDYMYRRPRVNDPPVCQAPAKTARI